MSLNFSPGWIIASFVVSAIGFVLFNYGRKMSRTPQLIVGVVMLVYPIFVPNIAAMLIVAGVLSAGLWVATRLGW